MGRDDGGGGGGGMSIKLIADCRWLVNVWEISLRHWISMPRSAEVLEQRSSYER
jgi:hypothetical protein